MGDLLCPNPLSKKDGGRHRIDILNDFNLTAAILGNHELDGGTANAKDRMEESNFPWLAANVFDRSDNYYTSDQQMLLFDRNGTRVGIFGLTSETTPDLVVLSNNLTFISIIRIAKRMVEALKHQVALVLCWSLSLLGYKKIIIAT